MPRHLLFVAVTHRGVLRATLAGVPVVERAFRLEIRGHFHWPWGEHADFDWPELRVVTALLTKERQPVQAVETVNHSLDVDADGTPSCGDVVRVDVKVSGDDLAQGSHFHQTLPPGTLLIPGSVVSSHGEVIVGNQPIDLKSGPVARRNQVEIDFGAVEAGEQVELSFEAVVAPEIRTQGVVGVVVDQAFG